MELGKLINTFSVPVPPMKTGKHLFNLLFTAPISSVSPEWWWLERAALVSGPGWKFPYPACLDLQYILCILPKWCLSAILHNVSSSNSAALCCLCWLLILKYLLSKWKGLSRFLRTSCNVPPCASSVQSIYSVFLAYNIRMDYMPRAL